MCLWVCITKLLCLYLHFYRFISNVLIILLSTCFQLISLFDSFVHSNRKQHFHNSCSRCQRSSWCFLVCFNHLIWLILCFLECMQLLLKRRRSDWLSLKWEKKETKLIKGNSYHYYDILLHLLYHNYYHILCDMKWATYKGDI